VNRFDTFGASLNSFGRGQANPLEIRVFSSFAGGIKFAAQLYQLGGHL